MLNNENARFKPRVRVNLPTIQVNFLKSFLRVRVRHVSMRKPCAHGRVKMIPGPLTYKLVCFSSRLTSI